MTSAGTLWDDESIQRVGMQSLLDLFNESCAGMMAVDVNARIAWINGKYLSLLGLKSADDILGKPVEEVLPNSRMREVVVTGKPIFLDIMTIRSQQMVVMRIPLKDENGQVSGALGFTLYDRLDRLKPLISKFTELESELAHTQKELASLRRSKYSLASFIGVSSASLELKRKARRAAQLDTTVLLLGETGTGKELLAHGIHAESARHKHPFVAINVAAIPETLLESEFFGVAPGAYTGADAKGRDGKFKVADRGTLFLDEVGDMPLPMQAKLLRVLQEQEIEPLGGNKVIKVNVRIIAATSQKLKQLVADGRFRSDLYYRLNVLPINLLPLRQRPDDVDALCEHLLAQISNRTGMQPRELSPAARKLLAEYAWPGNVRELRNVLEQAGMQTDNVQLDAEDFDGILPNAASVTVQSASPLPHYRFQLRSDGPGTALPSMAHALANPGAASEKMSAPLGPTPSDARIGSGPAPFHPAAQALDRSLSDAIAELERNYIQSALTKTGGNKASAARLLGISRATLYQKMVSYGLDSQ
ncbi:MAG: sigma 54-interacting transcriptional regulator [Burkholderiales bacterium]|nr:sigma 54-interacting transcriptional regulator [Burkholderiales bacterium]